MTVTTVHTRSGAAPAAPPGAPFPTPATVRALEQIETAVWTDLITAAPDAIRGPAGLRLDPVGGWLAGAAAAYDVLAFNRVLGPVDGAGGRPALDRALDRLIAHYRALGVRRAFFPWPPPAPGDRAWEALSRRGVRPHNRWVKLARDASPAPPVRSALTAARLDPGEGRVVAEILAGAFDWPPPLLALWAGLVGRPGWRHWAARDRGRPVAVAGLLVRGATAWLGPAATLPGHRGRGAQTLLIAERIAAARAAGCRLLAVETAEPTPERRVASFRNLCRMGFEIAYRRENYLIRT